MEDLIAQFSFLSNQALQDKSFDPSTIEDLMKLFEIEAYKSWAAAELEQEQEVEEAENSMQEAEDYLESVMESAMDEFRRFEEEMDKMGKDELDGLVNTAESARKMGKFMENAANLASKRYIEAALSSATATMKSAWKGISTNKKSQLTQGMGIPSEMRDMWVNRRNAFVIPSPAEEQRLSRSKTCTQEGVRQGIKAACIWGAASAVPTLAAVRMVPWAKANLNYTGQALIISAVSIAAYFITADKTILECARKNAQLQLALSREQ